MMLLARMIGCDQMLAPVLDPFDRTLELQRGGTDQNIFGINFAANAESAADMTFVELNGIVFAPQHLRDRIAIPVRHLGGTVQLQDIARFVVACDRAARFQRNAGVASDGKLKRNNSMSVAECSVDIAIPFLQDSRLRR